MWLHGGMLPGSIPGTKITIMIIAFGIEREFVDFLTAIFLLCLKI